MNRPENELSSHRWKDVDTNRELRQIILYFLRSDESSQTLTDHYYRPLSWKSIPTPPTPISSLRLARWQTAFPQINPRLHCCSIHHNPTEDSICSCLSVSLSPHTSSPVSLRCFSLQLLFDSFTLSRFLFLPLSHLWCNSSAVFFLCLWTPS